MLVFFLIGKFYVHPKYTGEINVIYVKDVEDFTIDTKEDEIPYPRAYHPILIDGASRFIFQGEGGLKNKDELLLANKQWEIGKRACEAFLSNQGNNLVESTYSKV